MEMEMVCTPEAIPEEIHTLTRAWLLAKTHAEYQREKMDALDRRLMDGPYLGLFTDNHTGETITDADQLYRTDLDSELYRSFSRGRADAIQEMGYDIHRDKCPALVAENELRIVERHLAEAWGDFLPNASREEFPDQLLLSGLDTHRKFIDLAIKTVVNLPTFQAPAIP